MGCCAAPTKRKCTPESRAVVVISSSEAKCVTFSESIFTLKFSQMQTSGIVFSQFTKLIFTKLNCTEQSIFNSS